MRIKITKTKVFPFNELTDEQKDKVVELLWDLNVSFEWWESIYEDAEQIGLKITEFDIDRGSYCRGEWTEDADKVAKLIMDNHGEPCETYKDAESFLVDFYKAKHAHENQNAEDYDIFEDTGAYDDIACEFKRIICEDYRLMLQKEYEYQTSCEAIIETIEANEYEFTKDGIIA